MRDQVPHPYKINTIIFAYISILSNRDSVVGIPIGYELEDRGVEVTVPVGSRIFSSPRPPNPSIQWVPGALPPGVKRQGREADHSSPTSAEVTKMLIYTSTPPYVFME
jgi:hypothetical protein